MKKNIVILDNLRSLNNIGSIFRTCDALKIKKLFLCGICGTPPNREINKTALGSTEFVDWEYKKSILDVIKKLKDDNYKIISIEQTKKSVELNNFEVSENDKIAFIFGNEVNGVSVNAINCSDLIIKIPQFGEKKSMNVSVCVGVILWDIFLKQN
ncbi:TrmH family RNA methyltransferase [Bacteroidota bacterium]|nr:TrmH family RNA methyltransferase [Bacteroidota bacterium]